MRKICMFAAAIGMSALALSARAGTIDPLNSGDMTSPVTKTSALYDMLILGVRWTYTIFFIIAVLFILIAAYNFIVGGKDEKKVTLAKNQLKYAVIAIAVALVSAGIAPLVKSLLTTGS